MTTPFDRALESQAAITAATEFALRHGQPGTPEYRSAWIRFRQTAATSDGRGELGPGPARNGLERPSSNGLKPHHLVREILDAALQRAMRVDGATMANAQLLNRRTQTLRLVAHQGFSREFLDFFKIVNDSTTACGSAVERGTPVLISDITDSPVFAGTAGLQVMLGAGCRAVASWPVRTPNGRLIAIISTHHPRNTTWTNRGVQELQELCNSTGHVLHQAMVQPRAEPPAGPA